MATQKEHFKVSSPDKKIEVSVKITHKIRYSVKFQGAQILSPSSLSLTLKNHVLGINPQVVEVSRQTADNIIRPVVREKNAVSN